ncbi:DUF4240 domain-containing protein [Streptomyces sp. NPDC005426]|uniref:DUF4240 domain-containing protein n=1 Tax=Streptomyces sp. NPDC005426 TaxID=3155344 RepID=UPI0033A08849
MARPSSVVPGRVLFVNLEKFWELVETCRHQTGARDARRAWIHENLSRRSLEESIEFHMCLDQVTHQACTWELVAAAERIFGGWCPDDDFCYFGLWTVGLGGEAFGRRSLPGRAPWGRGRMWAGPGSGASAP